MTSLLRQYLGINIGWVGICIVVLGRCWRRSECMIDNMDMMIMLLMNRLDVQVHPHCPLIIRCRPLWSWGAHPVESFLKESFSGIIPSGLNAFPSFNVQIRLLLSRSNALFNPSVIIHETPSLSIPFIAFLLWFRLSSRNKVSASWPSIHVADLWVDHVLPEGVQSHRHGKETNTS